MGAEICPLFINLKLKKMKRKLTDFEDALLGFALFIIMFGGFYIFLLTYLSK